MSLEQVTKLQLAVQENPTLENLDALIQELRLLKSTEGGGQADNLLEAYYEFKREQFGLSNEDWLDWVKLDENAESKVQFFSVELFVLLEGLLSEAIRDKLLETWIYCPDKALDSIKESLIEQEKAEKSDFGRQILAKLASYANLWAEKAAQAI